MNLVDKKIILLLVTILIIFGVFSPAFTQDIENPDYVDMVIRPKTLWDREALHFMYGAAIGYGYYFSVLKEREERKWHHWVVFGVSVAATGFITYKEIVLDPRENAKEPNLFVKTSETGDYGWGDWGYIDSQTKGVIDLCFYGTGGAIGVLIPKLVELKKARDKSRVERDDSREELKREIEEPGTLKEINIGLYYLKDPTILWEKEVVGDATR